VNSSILVVLLVLACSTRAWTPSQCPQDCVRPLSFWIQNRPGTGVFWPDNSETKTFTCGPSWLEVIVSTSTDSWTILAKQYIVAQLNILSFSCIDTLPASITQALTEALNLLSDDNCSVSNETLAVYLTAVIAEFSDGNGAVATCLCPVCPGGSNPWTLCPDCPSCPTQPPFACTPSVVDQCCQQPTPTPPPTTTRTAATTTPPPSCGPCTRTQGYFKTHPDVWADFTICGISALSILGSASSGGDAFIILARQYIAARLNAGVLGVCFDDIVSGAFAVAETLLNGACTGFGNYTAPAKDSDLRDEFVAIATILDNFNNGLLGPGHCNDETTSRITELYVNALESSFAMDDTFFSSAAVIVPTMLSLLVALLAVTV